MQATGLHGLSLDGVVFADTLHHFKQEVMDKPGLSPPFAAVTRPPFPTQTSSDSSLATLSSVSTVGTFSSISSSGDENPYASLVTVNPSTSPLSASPPISDDVPFHPSPEPSHTSFRHASYTLPVRPESGSFLASVSEDDDSTALSRLTIDDHFRAPSYGSPSSTSTYPPADSSSKSAFSFPPSTSMSRSLSAGARPSSAGTNSSGGSASGSGSSGRAWVRDSDCSSVASSLLSASSEGNGEVYRVNGSDSIEFLDKRPEPPGASLTISREDADQIILKVTLPGFSLDNITVAMRRGHKIHIVADKYSDEAGGHFEKLVSLGSEITSAAPRAEFNGTVLRVYVQRRHPRVSPAMSSSSSLASTSSAAYSPPLPSSATLSSPVMSDTAVLPSEPTSVTMGCKPTCRAGPEAAKAAAKKAKEEAARRAKEEAKVLPKVGKRMVFRWGSSGTPSTAPAAPPEPRSPPLSAPIPASSQLLKVDTTLDDGRSSGSESSPDSDDFGLSVSTDHGSGSTSPSSTMTTRPRLRTSDLNLTLRANEGESFVQAATYSASGGGGAALDAEGITPKVESPGFGFDAANGGQ